MELNLRSRYQSLTSHPDKYPLEAKWIELSARATYGVKFICYGGSTGYADASRGYIRSLFEIGIPVYVEVIRYYHGKTHLTDDDNVLAIGINNHHLKYSHVVIHAIPETWLKYVNQERTKKSDVNIYGLTVWETDSLHPQWEKMISDCKLKGVIVPSEWNRIVFRKSSHMPEIHVCHHAITGYVQGPHPPQPEYGGDAKTLKLLCIGTWTHRKGIEETVDAYLKTFKKHDNVVLYLKTSDGGYSAEKSLELFKRLHQIVKKYPDPPVIQLDASLRTDDFIASLINQCDVYISLCNSEGVGLGACQAAQAGKIIVMTGYGGQTEYISHGNWIDYKLGEVDVPNNFAWWVRPPQRWGYPNLDHASRVLADIYHRRQHYQKEALLNITSIQQKYSYTQIGLKMAQILDVEIPRHVVPDTEQNVKSMIKELLKKQAKIPRAVGAGGSGAGAMKRVKIKSRDKPKSRDKKKHKK